MKVVQINATCKGSTGKIAVDMSKLLNSKSIENYIFFSYGKSNYENAIKYMSYFEVKVNALISKITGMYGFCSGFATRRLIRKLKKINPDVVQLHNLHSHNVNLTLLFNYLKESKVKIIWTFHDCWAFTGYCTYFDSQGCDKWITGCKNCPQRKNASWFFDRSKKLYNLKKSILDGIDDLTIVTPSAWLAELSKQSMFKNFPIKVINNGIDLSIFKPSPSDFKKKHNIDDKYMLLGVASPWDKRKGLSVFAELSKMLDERFRIVLVGLSKPQIDALPENILGLPRTQNQQELSEIYSAADCFVNPTYEDNFPTVNLESLACGTPVITFNTGGSPECIDDLTGAVISKDDIASLHKAINNLFFTGIKTEDCTNRAISKFDAKERYNDYFNLYLGGF